MKGDADAELLARGDAADLTAETFAAALVARKRYRPERARRRPPGCRGSPRTS